MLFLTQTERMFFIDTKTTCLRKVNYILNVFLCVGMCECIYANAHSQYGFVINSEKKSFSAISPTCLIASSYSLSPFFSGIANEWTKRQSIYISPHQALLGGCLQLIIIHNAGQASPSLCHVTPSAGRI